MGWEVLVWIVLLLLALLVFAYLANRFQKPTLVVGRYQLCDVAGYAILLDTETGKTWQRAKYEDLVGEPSVWRPTAERVDNDAELQAWVSKQVQKPL